MSDEHIDNAALGVDEPHPEVAELDGQIANAAKEDMSDAEKEALNALIEQRNEAYKRNLSAA